MLFVDLKKHLGSSAYKSCYLLTGEDSFVLNKALKMLKAVITEMPELNITTFTEENETGRILEALEQLPMGGNRRMVIVENIDCNLKPLVKYLAHPLSSSILVLIYPKLGKNLNNLLKSVEVVECGRLKRDIILNWIANFVGQSSVQIKAAAAELLIDYCAGDMARIENELNKLCLYKAEGVIGTEDVESLVSCDLEFKIFDLTDAIATDAARAQRIYDGLIVANTAPVMLLGMIYSHFRRLMYVKVCPDDENLPRYLAVKEYAVKMSLKQAKLYTALKLKKIMELIHKSDADFKAGKITDKFALDVVLGGILDITKS